MNKKVLYISYNGMTDPLGQAQVLPYLFQLSKRGYSITVLSCEKKNKIESEGAYIKNMMHENGLKWHPLTFHDSLPVVSKIYDHYLLKKAAKQLFEKEKFEVVHCRSYVSAEIGLWLKKKYGIKLIFDMRGFWADEKKDSKHWNVDKLFYKGVYNYYKRLEQTLLLYADAIVVLTHAAKNEISQWNIGSDVINKIHVIPCCADLSHFSIDKVDVEMRSKLILELDLQDARPIICYLGSLGDSYALNEMLFFFDRLKIKHPNAKFLFFTKDAKQIILDKLSLYTNISSSDIIVKYIKRKDLPTYLSLVSFSVFFYVPTYSRIACSPTKFAEISGLNIPVICNSVGDLNSEYLSGLPHLVISDLEKKSIEDSIARLDTLDITNKSSIRKFAEEKYNLLDGADKYQFIYKSLTF